MDTYLGKLNINMNTMYNLIFDTNLDSNTLNGGTVFRKLSTWAKISKYCSSMKDICIQKMRGD